MSSGNTRCCAACRRGSLSRAPSRRRHICSSCPARRRIRRVDRVGDAVWPWPLSHTRCPCSRELVRGHEGREELDRHRFACLRRFLPDLTAVPPTTRARPSGDSASGCRRASSSCSRACSADPPATRAAFGERSTMLSIVDSDSPKKSSNEMPPVEAAEHEVAVDVHVVDRGHAVLRLARVEAGVLVPFTAAPRQRAVGLERPRVVRAAEELAGVAAGLAGDLHALVRQRL